MFKHLGSNPVFILVLKGCFSSSLSGVVRRLLFVALFCALFFQLVLVVLGWHFVRSWRCLKASITMLHTFEHTPKICIQHHLCGRDIWKMQLVTQGVLLILCAIRLPTFPREWWNWQQQQKDPNDGMTQAISKDQNITLRGGLCLVVAMLLFLFY